MVTALEHLQEISPISGNVDQALPTGKGSYALLLHLAEPAKIQVGRLGQWQFATGYYLYLGSALGSGGLAARLRRHLSGAARPFWHIDYLRQQAMVTAVWVQIDPMRRECVWATAVAVAGSRPSPCLVLVRQIAVVWRIWFISGNGR